MSPAARRLRDWLDTNAAPEEVYTSRYVGNVIGVTERRINSMAVDRAALRPYWTLASMPHAIVRAETRVWGHPDAIAQAIAEGY